MVRALAGPLEDVASIPGCVTELQHGLGHAPSAPPCLSPPKSDLSCL